jgi:hypothetical protein
MRNTTLVGILCGGAMAACGGSGKAKPDKPVTEKRLPVKKQETEADREVMRTALARAIVPDGSNCMPDQLRPADASPTLELGAVDGAPVVCAIDTDETRLLGPIACWTLDLKTGSMTYRAPAPLPGRGFPVRLDGTCARGFCLPADAEIPDPPIAHIAWSHGADKVAVALAGVAPEIHVFGAQDKAHQGVIKPKAAAHADKALTTDLAGLLFVGDVVAVVAAASDAGAPVFLFKTDGSAVGAVERLGGKVKGQVSVAHGSVSVFGDGQIALSEEAMASLTTIELATGKRAKLVRKPPKTSCKAKDVEALLVGNGEKVKAKCKQDYAKHYEPLIGGLFVQGKKNHLVLLRGGRFGELAVVDAKTLEENRQFPASWCPEAAPADDLDAAPADDDAETDVDAAPEE